MTSFSFRMDNLLAGTRFPPWEVHCAGMMSSAACPVEIIPGSSRKLFRDRAKTVRLPAGITVRHQPGIPFVFTPERFSRSPRNRVRFPPESPLKFGGCAPLRLGVLHGHETAHQ